MVEYHNSNNQSHYYMTQRRTQHIALGLAFSQLFNMYSLELYVLWKLFTAISVIKTLYDIGVLHITCWILVNLPLFSAFTVAAVVSCNTM